MARIREIAAPVDVPSVYDIMRPSTPAINALVTEYIWYCLKFFAMFLAAAPGKTRREFKISKPTQEMESVMMIAIATVKTVCVV